MSETTPPPPYTGSPDTGDRGRREQAAPRGLAVSALVLGILAFLTGLVPVLGLLLGLAAVTLGILTLRRVSTGVAGGRGFGITGLVLGAIAALTGVTVLVLAVIGLAAGGSDTASAPTSTPTSTEVPAEPAPVPEVPEPSEEPAPAPPPEAEAPGIGTAVTADDGAQYTVTAFSCGIPSVGEEPFASVAQGEYCQLDLTLTNTGDRAVLFNASEVDAYAGDVEYQADAEASLYVEGNAFLEDINPGNTLASTLFFDVPPGTPLDRVVLGAGFLAEGVTIRLS